MSERKKRCTAIVLAAGSGKRMQSDVPKQFMLLGDKPVIWYSLHAVERSEVIDDCILVTGEEDMAYARTEIVERYGFAKVRDVVAGGRERYESVYKGLSAMDTQEGYTFIQDGARPFLTEEILEKLYQAVIRHRACVAAMPVKDTVKIADEEGFAVQTPPRSLVWAVQTPQVFETALIHRAYEMLFERLKNSGQAEISVTDDAMVAEAMLNVRVKLVEASYRNMKITTPEDMGIARVFMEEMAGGFPAPEE